MPPTGLVRDRAVGAASGPGTADPAKGYRFDWGRRLLYAGGVEQDPSPSDDRERSWRRLERALPELIRRLMELGYERISEGPENVRHLVNELRLPKEVLQVIVGQMEDTKNSVVRAVAHEVQEFLEKSDVTEALTRALSSLSLEIRTEVRFVPHATGPKPEIRSTAKLSRTPTEQDGLPESAPEEKL
ncbi:hypothetical protein ACFL5O_00620 [Myxococcota bacterium]